GDRTAEGAPRGRAGGEAFFAPGRGLRRDVRGLSATGHREQAQDPSSDVARVDPRGAGPGHSYRAFRWAVRQTAFEPDRDERGRRATELLRRQYQSPYVYRRGAPSGSDVDDDGAPSRRDDVELRALPSSGGVRRRASPRILGAWLFQARARHCR